MKDGKEEESESVADKRKKSDQQLSVYSHASSCFTMGILV